MGWDAREGKGRHGRVGGTCRLFYRRCMLSLDTCAECGILPREHHCMCMINGCAGGWYVPIVAPHRCRVLSHEKYRYTRTHRVAVEGRLPAQQDVQQHPKAPHVGRLVVLLAEHLWGLGGWVEKLSRRQGRMPYTVGAGATRQRHLHVDRLVVLVAEHLWGVRKRTGAGERMSDSKAGGTRPCRTVSGAPQGVRQTRGRWAGARGKMPQPTLS